MVVIFDIQTILTYLTLISIPVGVFYHIMTLRNTRKNQELQLETRQAQLFMQIYNVFYSSEFQKNFWTFIDKWEFTDVDDFQERFNPNENTEVMVIINSLGGFFEGLGVMIHRKLIEASLVDDLLSGCIIQYWEKNLPLAEALRRDRGWPQYLEWSEYLYNVIKAIVDEQHPELQT